jgi:protein gp37
MKTTKIEWTEATWNPSIGCTKVSAGCKNCYAEVMARRLQAMGVRGYENGFSFSVLPERLEQPYLIKKPTTFFVNSMSDLFHEDMTFSFLDKVFKTIRETPQHHYQILTKREKKLKEYFAIHEVPNNAWLGVTVENADVKERIDVLRAIDVPIRFLSIEPLIDDVGILDLTNIHWVIVGGESGVNARRMDPAWLQNVQRQCETQNVAFFFKQWGAWGSDGKKRSKYANGKEINGKIYQSYPKAATA